MSKSKLLATEAVIEAYKKFHPEDNISDQVKDFYAQTSNPLFSIMNSPFMKLDIKPGDTIEYIYEDGHRIGFKHIKAVRDE